MTRTTSCWYPCCGAKCAKILRITLLVFITFPLCALAAVKTAKQVIWWIMHKAAMGQWKAMTARINKEPVMTYSPVACGLLSPSMNENTKSQNFDISFVIAKKCLQNSTMHKLEERHGVDLGQSYKTCESVH